MYLRFPESVGSQAHSLPSQVFHLESGLCLLSRLKNMRRLELNSEFPYYYYKVFQPQHFTWIQGGHINVDVYNSSRSISERIASLFFLHPRCDAEIQARHLWYRNQEHCIEHTRKLSFRYPQLLFQRQSTTTTAVANDKVATHVRRLRVFGSKCNKNKRTITL